MCFCQNFTLVFMMMSSHVGCTAFHFKTDQLIHNSNWSSCHGRTSYGLLCHQHVVFHPGGHRITYFGAIIVAASHLVNRNENSIDSPIIKQTISQNVHLLYNLKYQPLQHHDVLTLHFRNLISKQLKLTVTTQNKKMNEYVFVNRLTVHIHNDGNTE